MPRLPRLPVNTASLKSWHPPSKPYIFAPQTFTANIPAISTWFTNAPSNPPPPTTETSQPQQQTLNLEYFTTTLAPSALSRAIPLESTAPGEFEQIQLPLALFLQYLSLPTKPDGLPDLYLAQTPLLDSFPELLDSFKPGPELLEGRKEVYTPNVWLGRSEAIDTPLHKDPNGNLFVQLAGRKKIRVFAPDVGLGIFERLRIEVGRLRGVEMMVGEGREKVERAVWEDRVEGVGEGEVAEAEVEAGDAVYIPRGWWHAVKGVGEGVNGSVNWWFR